MDIPSRLRMLRAAQDITQVELARRAGVEPVTLTRIEKAQRSPRPATLKFLAEALDVPDNALTDDLACFQAMAKILKADVRFQDTRFGATVGYDVSDPLPREVNAPVDMTGTLPERPVPADVAAELRKVNERLERLEREVKERPARPTSPRSAPSPRRPTS